MVLVEQISYECGKSRHTARSRHDIEEIFSTNHSARALLINFSSNVRTVTFSQSYEICSISTPWYYGEHYPNSRLNISIISTTRITKIFLALPLSRWLLKNPIAFHSDKHYQKAYWKIPIEENNDQLDTIKITIARELSQRDAQMYPTTFNVFANFWHENLAAKCKHQFQRAIYCLCHSLTVLEIHTLEYLRLAAKFSYQKYVNTLKMVHVTIDIFNV
jgi:hypothetical protein